MQPLFGDQIAQAPSGFLLEQTLQMRWAQLNFDGQLAHRAGRLRFDSIQHLIQPPLSKERLEAATLRGRPEYLRLIE